MTDIARLFAEDPLNFTKADITEIIKYYRQASASFANGERAAGATKKLPGAPKAPKEKKLDLDDLLD